MGAQARDFRCVVIESGLGKRIFVVEHVVDFRRQLTPKASLQAIPPAAAALGGAI